MKKIRAPEAKVCTVLGEGIYEEVGYKRNKHVDYRIRYSNTKDDERVSGNINKYANS